MTNRIKFLVVVLILLSHMACEVKPQPIAYGSDTCHFCTMTIVDRQHAAEFITQKGKGFKFDATECMLNHLKEIDTSDVGLYLVNNYNIPGELIDATQATFLISPGIPSPMGANITAFQNPAEANIAQRIHKGDLLSWEQLLKGRELYADVRNQ